MIGLRPKSSGLYLQRDSLLSAFPQESGFVVWLEAPYGYGKSVLASQWADQLENEGWRVVWLALQGRSCKAALALALNLPEDAPWAAILEGLWQLKTLLVLEDLDGSEDLRPILSHIGGLVLLASRASLSYAELPKLLLSKRLIHLSTESLAFSLEETQSLVPDAEKANLLWKRTQGWSLPLHFSVLTGKEPNQDVLIEGIKASLSSEAWQETLFLAALPYLGENQGTELTRDLVRRGFVQPLERAFRLHPLAAEALLLHSLKDVQSAVKVHALRLKPLARADAFRRSELFNDLGSLLDEPLALFEITPNPELLLELLHLIKQPLTVHQRYNQAIAESLLGKVEASSLKLIALATEIQKDRPNDALFMLGLAAYDLADLKPDIALAASIQGSTLLSKASEQGFIHDTFLNAADLFLNNASRAHWRAGDFETAENNIIEALELIPSDREDRVIAVANIAHLRWLGRGDLEGYILAIEHMIPFCEKVATYNLPYLYLELAIHKSFLGEFEACKQYLANTIRLATNPLERIEAEARLAFLEQDSLSFSGIFANLGVWENPRLEDRVLALWARCLLESEPTKAWDLLISTDGFECNLVRALILKIQGQSEEALTSLAPKPVLTERANYLAWLATHYRVQPSQESLTELINASLAAERILPNFIPFNELIRFKASHAFPYPLKTVLESDWLEAIELRKDEIPPLELSLLGKFELRFMGQTIELTDRLKQILCLLTLGFSRDQIAADMWPEADTKKSRNNLNVQLNFLRKAIEPWGVSTYLFESGLEKVNSDFKLLEEALDADDAANVLALYKGLIAASLDLPLISETRASLNQEVIDCLFEASLDEPENTARAFLERVMELEPGHEEALQALVKLLLSLGRRREAKKLYLKFESFLKEALDLAPLAETRALFD